MTSSDELAAAQERIHKLEAAIKFANGWVEAEEGMSLLAYVRYMANTTVEQELVALLKELIEND